MRNIQKQSFLKPLDHFRKHGTEIFKYFFLLDSFCSSSHLHHKFLILAKYGHKAKSIVCFQKRPKDGAESALCLCSNMSTGLVDIYEIERSQRHLLATLSHE